LTPTAAARPLRKWPRRAFIGYNDPQLKETTSILAMVRLPKAACQIRVSLNNHL